MNFAVPAVSTWIAGLSQAGLISERRPRFPKAIGMESPRPAPRAVPYKAAVSLPADLDTASSSAATTGASAATVRNKLDPE